MLKLSRTAKCPNCGKDFRMIDPHAWAYKIGTKRYCSYSCFRVAQKQRFAIVNAEIEKQLKGK